MSVSRLSKNFPNLDLENELSHIFYEDLEARDAQGTVLILLSIEILPRAETSLLERLLIL